MKSKYNSVLDLSKPMLYLVTVCGVIMPNFESRVFKPQITMAVLKPLGKFTSSLLFFFFWVNIYSVLRAPAGTPFQEKIFFVVVAMNACCCCIRITTLVRSSGVITEFLKQFNTNFQNKLQSTLRQNLIRDNMKIINTVAVSYITMQVTITYISDFYSLSKFGREVHPNFLPGNPDSPIRVGCNVSMEIIIGTTYIISMTSFEWILLAYLRLTTIELMIVRRQLTTIFSTLVWNEKHGICVTSQNIEYGLGAVDISEKDAFDADVAKKSLISIDSQEGWDTYKKVMKLSNKYLNEIIAHHSRHVILNQRVKNIFGTSILLTYIFTVFLSISWIIASGAEDDSPDGNAYLLPPFSIMAFMTLAYLSFFGEELQQAGQDIPCDVMGLDWFLYPIPMKKKLVIILRMCQEPFVLNAWGQGPLGYESFKKSCEACYSLFTFLQGSSA